MNKKMILTLVYSLLLLFLSCICIETWKGFDRLTEKKDTRDKEHYYLDFYFKTSHQKTLYLPFILMFKSGEPYKVAVSYQQPEYEQPFKQMQVDKFLIENEKGIKIDLLKGQKKVLEFTRVQNRLCEYQFDDEYNLAGKYFTLNIEVSLIDYEGRTEQRVYSYKLQKKKFRRASLPLN